MRRFPIALPELAFIAATRGALGFGIGLLLSSRFSASTRKNVGWTLVSIGALTTIPAARTILDRHALAAGS